MLQLLALSAVVALHWPLLVVYALVVFGSLVAAVVKPASCALVPQLVAERQELTAANALYCTMEGAGTLLGPALAGVLVGVFGPSFAFAAIAVLSMTGVVVTLGIRCPAPTRAEPRRGAGQAMAAQRQAQVAGLALVCPLLPGVRNVPEHRVVAGSGEIGDEVFRSYFVIQTPEMLERYERYVAPAAPLVDQAALERIGERWALPPGHSSIYAGPTIIVAGRLDSTVGYAAAIDLFDQHPHASLAVVDDAGHALPHEQPELLRALLAEWLARVARSD